ncbi:MAG: tetratricopeptide repeat protein [Pseudomonadota bacterium]
MPRSQTVIALAALIVFSTPANSESTEPTWTDAYRAYQTAAQSGEADATLSAARQVFQLASEQLASDDKRLVALSSNLASALQAADQSEEAAEAFEQTIALANAVYGEQSDQHFDLYSARAFALHDDRKIAPAYKAYEALIDLAESRYGDDSGDFATWLLFAGKALYDECRSVAGTKWIRRAHSILERESVKQPQYQHALARASFYLAKTRLTERKRFSAETYFKQAVENVDRSAPDGDTLLRASHRYLLGIYSNNDDEAAVQRQREVLVAMGPQDEPETVYVPLHRTPPSFPVRMARGKTEGFIDLIFTVDKEGRPVDVDFSAIGLRNDSDEPSSDMSTYEVQAAVDAFSSRKFRSHAKSLINIAKDTLEEWRYMPQVIDGEPVETEGVETRLTFEMAPVG